MKFEPGRPKTGGIQKGGKHKSTVAIEDYLSESGILLPQKLMDEVYPKLKPEAKAKVLLAMMDYIYPKRRAVEVTHQDNREEKLREVEELKARVLKLLPQAHIAQPHDKDKPSE